MGEESGVEEREQAKEHSRRDQPAAPVPGQADAEADQPEYDRHSDGLVELCLILVCQWIPSQNLGGQRSQLGDGKRHSDDQNVQRREIRSQAPAKSTDERRPGPDEPDDPNQPQDQYPGRGGDRVGRPGFGPQDEKIAQ